MAALPNVVPYDKHTPGEIVLYVKGCVIYMRHVTAYRKKKKRFHI